MRFLADGSVDVLIADAALGSGEAQSLIDEAARVAPDVAVVLLVEGGVDHAVAALRAGASDCVRKPVEPEDLIFVVGKALSSRRAATDAALPNVAPRGLLFRSKAMAQVESLIRRAAPGQSTVLIRGESGTGKELVARAIHEQSRAATGRSSRSTARRSPTRCSRASCSATRRARSRARPRASPGGSSWPRAARCSSTRSATSRRLMQVKLLRLLQEREFERLGGTQTAASVDVRFVAATHRDARGADRKRRRSARTCSTGSTCVPIWMPPLRARPDDIDLLARALLPTVRARRTGARELVDQRRRRWACCGDQPWPGNVRQLQNFDRAAGRSRRRVPHRRGRGPAELAQHRCSHLRARCTRGGAHCA